MAACGVERVGTSRRPAGLGERVLHSPAEMMVPCWIRVAPAAVERCGQIKDISGGRQLTWCVMLVGGDERGLCVTCRILS